MQEAASRTLHSRGQCVRYAESPRKMVLGQSAWTERGRFHFSRSKTYQNCFRWQSSVLDFFPSLIEVVSDAQWFSFGVLIWQSCGVYLSV